jgi:hypothetical protein
MFVLPMITAPASLSRCTWYASVFVWNDPSAIDPAEVGISTVS